MNENWNVVMGLVFQVPDWQERIRAAPYPEQLQGQQRRGVPMVWSGHGPNCLPEPHGTPSHSPSDIPVEPHMVACLTAVLQKVGLQAILIDPQLSSACLRQVKVNIPREHSLCQNLEAFHFQGVNRGPGLLVGSVLT